MAVAVVAARLRSVLIDAAAAYRQGDEFEVLNQLVRVAGVLDRFPLPERSPQADMIATAVQQRATLQERQVCGWPPLHIVVAVFTQKSRFRECSMGVAGMCDLLLY